MTEYAGRGDPAKTMALLWGDPLPARPGPKQRLDIEQVVRTSIAIADASGLTDLSMRRVAEAVGVGTMSLYTYVPSKAELLELMVDRAIGDADQTPGTGSWRDGLDSLARGAWELYRRHAWLLGVSVSRTVFGPNVLARYEGALAVAGRSGLPPGDVVGIVSLLDGHARGSAQAVVDAEAAAPDAGTSDDDWWLARAPLLDERLAAGNYPALMAVSAAGAFDQPDNVSTPYTVQRALDEFEFGLECILDGIAARVGAVNHETGRPT